MDSNGSRMDLVMRLRTEMQDRSTYEVFSKVCGASATAATATTCTASIPKPLDFPYPHTISCLWEHGHFHPHTIGFSHPHTISCLWEHDHFHPHINEDCGGMKHMLHTNAGSSVMDLQLNNVLDIEKPKDEGKDVFAVDAYVISTWKQPFPMIPLLSLPVLQHGASSRKHTEQTSTNRIPWKPAESAMTHIKTAFLRNWYVYDFKYGLREGGPAHVTYVTDPAAPITRIYVYA
ncbi:uncharacterized protein LOC125905808 isoform X1 [Scomber scombrus]|uniref:Uncharacterized protein LOC125905808 isoform X1 n=1 Tax=Scomber scombrus TaxID=13677 RepID=A0AAV1MT09_SCOSC